MANRIHIPLASQLSNPARSIGDWERREHVTEPLIILASDETRARTPTDLGAVYNSFPGHGLRKDTCKYNAYKNSVNLELWRDINLSRRDSESLLRCRVPAAGQTVT